jgi:hypothetical protein
VRSAFRLLFALAATVILVGLSTGCSSSRVSSDEVSTEIQTGKSTRFDAPPNCGVVMTSDMPHTTQLFLAANHVRNAERALISADIDAREAKATASDVRAQLDSDVAYADALRRISFPPSIDVVARRYLEKLSDYDGFLQRMLDDVDRGVPFASAYEAEFDQRGLAASDFTAAGLDLRAAIGVAPGTCRFYTP